MEPRLVELFTNPPPHFGPTPLWWWSGARVTAERIDFQLQRFIDGGIRDLVLMNLAPKGPTYGAPPDDPPWFSERWWDLVDHTCRRAQEWGLRLWFYDQIGFSGANIQGTIVARNPEAAGRSLHSWTTTVRADGELGLGARDHLIEAYSEREGSGSKRVGLPGGRARAEPGTSVRVVCWRETAFDYLSPQACALLIDAVHGEFDRRLPGRLGRTIVGSFQDELPAMPTWTERFTSTFAERHGYDLLDHLPSLWERGGDADDAIRSDYHAVRTHLAQEAFFAPLARWHEERGMLLGADQTNPARSGQPAQSSQLYGDYFATHRWVSAVGSDHEGDARVHSSMADLYHHPRVWIESFHSSGWGGTMADTWDWLLPFFRSGADLYNPHATYFDTRAGWFEWAPPATDFRQPYYALYPAFAAAVARTAALLTWGRHIVDIGLLYPAATGHAELTPDEPIDYFGTGAIGAGHERTDAAQAQYVALAGRNDWFRSAPGLLDRAGLDFDIVDEDSLVSGSVRGEQREALLEMGSVALKVLVLPSVSHLQPGSAEQLCRFLDAGGRVVVVGTDPVSVAGTAATAQERAALAELVSHPDLERVADAEAACDLLAERGTDVWAPTGLRARRSGDVAVAFVPAAFPNATAYPLRQDETLRWEDIDIDPARYQDLVPVHIRGPVAAAEVWNPATGRRRAVPVAYDGERSVIDVGLHGAPAVFLAWTAGEQNPGAPADLGSPGGEEIAGAAHEPEPVWHTEEVDTSTWSHDLVPTLDNTWGDLDLPAGRRVPLEIWRMDWTDGRQPPQGIRATFGQQVLALGPQQSPPAPLTADDARAIRGGADLGAGPGAGWNRQWYSLSRGRDTDASAKHEPKGFVPEEFLLHPAPGPGQTVTVRTILRLPEPGRYVLTVAAPAAKRIWFDGAEVTPSGTDYALAVTVHADHREAVLEYRIGASEAYAGVHGTRPDTVPSWFMVEREHVPRPEFIAPGTAEGHAAVLRTDFEAPFDAQDVRLTAGGTAALRIEIDGVPLARQEKVEYYESAAVNRPMYFTHELGHLAAGPHELAVVAESADPEHAIWVDLVATAPGGARYSVVSNGSWTAEGHPVQVVAGLGGGTTHARSARYPHPLPETAWLAGPTQIGQDAVPVEAATSAIPRDQRFDVVLPAGTREVHLPLEDLTIATLDGVQVPVREGVLELAEPLAAPGRLTLITEPRAFSTAGAMWRGPVTVRTGRWRGPLGDWRAAGLGAWSGAIRSTGQVRTRPEDRLRLDLGAVRGAVQVSYDGEVIAELFCGPYAVELPVPNGDVATPGEATPGQTPPEETVHEVSVTVFGTLAPRLESVSPTPFLPPSQLQTGILGPVRLLRGSSAQRAGGTM